MKLVFSVLLVAVFMSCNQQHNKNEPTAQTAEKYELEKDTSVYGDQMKRYWLVLLKKGPNRNQDSLSAEKIQAAHIANIERLAKLGKILMAGPMGVEDDIRGIFLMNCKDSTEVEEFVKTDTAVITGRLKMEYFPWWTMKGKYVFK
jgi:uncharacterized protein YciI